MIPLNPHPLRSVRVAALVALASIASTASAQVAASSVSAKPATESEPITLSAFEVTPDKDVGYQGGNTASGSRLNSSLKDTAAAVMVFTPEFLSDFGANGLAEMTAYSPNLSVDMLETSSDANPTFIGGSDLTDTRIVVRGLSASASMDFFEAGIAIDNYNTERVELASGPNSILFGFGSPGGLVNVMTKRAQVNRNRTALRTQFGEWAFRRFELDHNQVILPGKLALRLNGLDQRAAGWRRWDRSDSSRGAASLRFTPTRKTSWVAGYENGQLSGHVALPMNAFDANALWLANGRRTANDATWTTADRNVGINRNTAVRNLAVTGSASAAPFVLTTRNAVGFRILESSYDNLNLAATQRAGLTMAPFSEIPLDTSVFGPGATRDTNFDRLTSALEHRFTPTVTLELAYLHERTKQWVISPVNNLLLYGGDPNVVIPHPDGSATPIANPNVGRAYIDAQWKNDDGRTGNDVVRASLAVKLDRGRFGVHNLAFMAEHGDQSAWRYPGREIFVDEQGVPIANAALPENANNFITRRHYVTPGRPDTYIGGNADQEITVVRNGRTYRRAWLNQSVAGGSIRRTMDSFMGVTQSSFFKQRLIVTGGVRWDKFSFDQLGNSRLGADHPLVRSGQRVLNSLTFTEVVTNTQTYKPVTSTVGAMWHVTPVFSVFYNQGDNNAQPKLNAVILPDEKLPPPAEGKTRDYGVTLSLLDGKIYARATAFQTSQKRAAGGNFNINIRGGAYDLAAPSTRILATLAENGRITAAEELFHTIGDESNLGATSDIVNKGYEFSAWFNLAKNLTGVVNFSHTQSDRSNVFPEFEGWYERERAFWLRTPGAGALVNSTANLSISQDAATIQRLASELRDFYNFGFGERPYKANASGRYTFTEGRLKGAYLGGGVRWQDRSKLGRISVGTAADGSTLYGRTLIGPEDFKMDAFAGYRRRAPFYGRNAEMIFQVNVTNFTDEDVFMPLRYNSQQSGYLRILLQDPRRVRFTFGVNF